MKKFVYSMQSILDIKQKLEEQERNHYAQAQQRLNAENDKLETVTAKYDSFLEQCRRQLADGPVSAQKMRRNKEMLEWQKESIRQQAVLVRKAEQNVEVALSRMQHAVTERKAQERLREKAFDEYKLEVEAQERKEVDELVSFRFGTGADQ